MEEVLCHAALHGDLDLLREIIAEDDNILDKVLVGCFKGKNPLLLATLKRQAEFVEELLKIEPKLAEVVVTEQGAALHIASANWDLEIVEALVERRPEMCMARNRNGHNPLHIAAMDGQVDVPKKNGSNLPPCSSSYFVVHSKDANGNTILHIAVYRKRFEIVEHVLYNTEINWNATNGAGWTARDLNFFVRDRGHKEDVDDQIENLFHAVRAKRGRQILVSVSASVKGLLETIMVVASLFATMAFQVGVNPPGGVWQEDAKDYQAGESVFASKHPVEYRNFMYFNTVGFLMSLAAILVLLILAVPFPKTHSGCILPVMSVLTILTAVYAYTKSVIVLSPKHLNGDVTYYSFVVVMAAFLMLVGSILFVFALERWRTKKHRERMSESNPTNADGENTSGV